jgi:hypothetical protein
MNAIFTGRKRSGKTTLAFDIAMRRGGGGGDMSVQETTCPECGVKTTAWVGGLQTPEQRNLERACSKHREMYKLNVQVCASVEHIKIQ